MSDLNKLRISPSPLNLDGYFIKKLSFSVSDDIDRDSINTLLLTTGLHPQLETPFEAGKPYFSLEFKVGANEDNDSQYKCTLSVNSIKKRGTKQPYNFEAEIVAFFTWTPKKSEFPNFEAAMQTSAITLMYSTLREALASATARSHIPALVLPSLWFKFSSEESDGTKTKEHSSKPQKKITKKSAKS